MLIPDHIYPDMDFFFYAAYYIFAGWNSKQKHGKG
jgi:hypothetical protein